MGRAYVDDHRFILYHDGATRDITEAVGSPELRDELSALSVELSFTAVRNNLNDKYMHWYDLTPGDKLRVVNHDKEIFSGVIRTVGLDGAVTANDPGWYLTRSQIVLQCSNASASDAVARMCAKAGIPVGTLDLPPTKITQAWFGESPESILQDVIAICAAETGKTYKRRVKEGKLTVVPLSDTPQVIYHRPADNLAAFDVTLAKGSISGSDSIDDLVNSYILTADNSESGSRVLGRAENAASIAKYGLLQQVESLSGDETTAQARQRLKTLLAQNDRITKERQVEELWGADEMESGVLVQFVGNRTDISGVQRVTAVTHRYGHPHLMSVTVTAPNQPRAAGSADTVTV